jgi:hypothetical protein
MFSRLAEAIGHVPPRRRAAGVGLLMVQIVGRILGGIAGALASLP